MRARTTFTNNGDGSTRARDCRKEIEDGNKSGGWRGGYKRLNVKQNNGVIQFARQILVDFLILIHTFFIALST